MKLRLSMFAILILLLGCGPKGDAAVHKSLPGTWIYSDSQLNGGYHKDIIKIDPSGRYVCETIIKADRDSLTSTSNIAGSLEVRDGVMFDTVTNHSNPNARLPKLYRYRIVRHSAREIVFNEQRDEKSDFTTDEGVWRKELR